MSYLRNYGYYYNKQVPKKHVLTEWTTDNGKVYLTAIKWVQGTMRSGIVEYLKVVENGKVLFESV